MNDNISIVNTDYSLDKMYSDVDKLCLEADKIVKYLSHMGEIGGEAYRAAKNLHTQLWNFSVEIGKLMDKDTAEDLECFNAARNNE